MNEDAGITRIDQSQIKPDQTYFRDNLYDADGTLVGQVPKKSYSSEEEWHKEMQEQANDATPQWPEAVPFKDLAILELGEPEWTVRRLIPKGGITVISSPPGLYKSFLLSHIAIVCAMGDKALGEYETQHQAVMVVDEENHKNRIARRIKLLTDQLDLPIHYHIAHGFKVDDEQTVKELIREAKDKNVGLIMFDTLVRIHRQDENSATAMNLVYQGLKKFTEAGITLVIAHHHRKQGGMKTKTSDTTAFAESMRGSSDILGMVDAHLAIMGRKDESGAVELIAVQTKQRDEELLKPFKIKVVSEAGKISFVYNGEYDEKISTAQEAQERMLVILQDDNSGLSREDFVKSLKGIAADTSIRTALQQLTRDGRITAKTRSQLRKEGIDKGEGGSTTKFYFPNQGDEV
ncbi:MAG: hypothetical protein A3I29_02025 [Candidatus Magasanikbacteria bacterium RIFCSPLOWO2_02_FULL_44_11]|uniref:AAA+ ATPase domain-containing protein n=1 Tax=Candidatus Magasanikbacteria bacterium RIFCSPLOWO2_02_FULL_44_11 TaxID=1798689 RepID=A0A1F6NAS6_9BACT|nr:MAG: hypothetical protein A3I29_02025 [Candidatus Magasanikbacteria bacterium RIFCSPLOWO2_02_FULL_44_11]